MLAVDLMSVRTHSGYIWSIEHMKEKNLSEDFVFWSIKVRIKKRLKRWKKKIKNLSQTLAIVIKLHWETKGSVFLLLLDR